MSGKVFKINESRDILDLGDFTIPKIDLQNQITVKPPKSGHPK